jgi:hypothetical protein
MKLIGSVGRPRSGEDLDAALGKTLRMAKAYAPVGTCDQDCFHGSALLERR